MKRHQALRVDQIIRQSIEQSGAAPDFDRHRICYLWPEVVGPTVNRHTSRRWVDGDTMHVCITSASLKNELGFMASHIVKRLNEAAGRNIIARIVFH